MPALTPLSTYALKKAAQKLDKAHPDPTAMHKVLSVYHEDQHDAIILRMQQLWKKGGAQ